MKKIIYAVYALMFTLLMLLSSSGFIINMNQQFLNQIIPTDSYKVTISNISDREQFIKYAKQVTNKYDLYIVKKDYKSEDGNSIAYYYVNDTTQVKELNWYNDARLIGDEYIGTVSNDDENQVGTIDYFRNVQRKVCDLNSNIDNIALTGEYYIYGSVSSGDENIQYLNNYADIIVNSNNVINYNLINDIGTLIITIILSVIFVYMSIYYEKTKVKKNSIRLLYGNDVRKIIKDEYINLALPVNIISIIIGLIINGSLKIVKFGLLIECVILIVIVNIVMYISIRVYMKSLEKRQLVNFINGKFDYKVLRSDYIIKVILSLLLIISFSLVISDIISLSHRLRQINTFWNINENYITINGFSLGDDGADFEKINSQLNNTVEELKRAGAVYTEYHQEGNELVVSPEYFKLNPVKLIDGTTYEYKNNAFDVLLDDATAVTDEEMNRYEQLGAKIYYYPSDISFPVYNERKFSMVTNPVISVREPTDNIDYISHILIPINKSIEETSNYYMEILKDDNGIDNIGKVSTLDDDVNRMRNQTILVIIIMAVFGTLLFSIEILVFKFILIMNIGHQRKKVAIYKFFEIPRRELYNRILSNLLFSYVVLILLTVTIIVYAPITPLQRLVMIITCLLFIAIEFLIAYQMIRREEQEAIMSVLKGER